MSLERYAYTAKTQDGPAQVYRAFLEVPASYRDFMVPAAIVEQVRGDAVSIPLHEFTLNLVDVPNSDPATIIFLLSADYTGTGIRQRVTTLEDLTQWVEFVEGLGFSRDNLLTLEERNAKLGDV